MNQNETKNVLFLTNKFFHYKPNNLYNMGEHNNNCLFGTYIHYFQIHILDIVLAPRCFTVTVVKSPLTLNITLLSMLHLTDYKFRTLMELPIVAMWIVH